MFIMLSSCKGYSSLKTSGAGEILVIEDMFFFFSEYNKMNKNNNKVISILS